MEFSKWFYLKESELPLQVDSRNVIYTACVLHKFSQQNLISEVTKWLHAETGAGIPVGWVKRAHHMTVKFKPSQVDINNIASLLKEEVKLTVTNWAHDDHGVAVVVKPDHPLTIGQTPHVTVAHSKDVKPVYSNTLLANHKTWKLPPSELVLTSYLLGVSGNGTIPQMGSDILAKETV